MFRYILELFPEGMRVQNSVDGSGGVFAVWRQVQCHVSMSFPTCARMPAM